MMRKIKENKGFTLAELLIVVAIIAVLVAIAIPIFTTQLEKSREAVDEANIRSLYAEATAAVLGCDTSASTTINGATLTCSQGTDGVYTCTATYVMTHQKDGLEGGATSINIGGVSITASSLTKGKTVTIVVKSDGTAPSIT